MSKEELIKSQFPNDEFLQSVVLQIVNKCVSDLEEENAGLKNRNQELLESCEGATMMYKDLQKAKKIIKKLLHTLENKGSEYTFALKPTHPVLVEAEQFIKEETKSEVEKWKNLY